jgi:hypothetical protein
MRIPITLLLLAVASPTEEKGDVSEAQPQAEVWRAEHRTIDLHQHISGTTQHISRAVKIMDAVGIGIAVNLSGGTVTRPKPDEPSEFERTKAIADTLFPGRFLYYMNLDYAGLNEPDFAERAVKQIEGGHRLGAAGFKEYKRLGLFLRDAKGKLLKVDDPKLDGMWERCGELPCPCPSTSPIRRHSGRLTTRRTSAGRN